MTINRYTLDKDVTGIVVYRKYEEVGIVLKGETYPNSERFWWGVPKGMHPNVQKLGDDISDYLRRMEAQGQQDKFALINLPEEGIEKGIRLDSDYLNAKTLNEISSYHYDPLNTSEFLELQQIVGARFPLIWGIPERPLSDIPKPLPFGLVFGELVERALIELRKLGIELPPFPELRRIQEFYRRRN